MNLKQCRICLDGGNNLITVCDCIGSVQFVHQKCIQTWIETTTNPESKKKCEVCHATYKFSPADTYMCGEYYSIIIPGNFLIAFLLAAPIHYVSHTFSYLAWSACITFAIILLELIYSVGVIFHYKLHVYKICARIIHCVALPLTTSMCLIPMSLERKEFFLGVSFIFAFVLNTAVLITFTEINKQLSKRIRRVIAVEPKRNEIIDLSWAQTGEFKRAIENNICV